MATERIEAARLMVGHRHRLSRSPAAREAIAGYLFAAPTVVGYLAFAAGPVLAAVALSFLEWNILTPPRWIGLGNYAQVLADERVFIVYRNTIWLAFLEVLAGLIVPLALAAWANQRVGTLVTYVCRTGFFFPVLMSSAVVSVIWFYFFHYDLGAINYYLTQLGGPRIPWLISTAWAIPSILVLHTWHSTGFNFVVFVAGLQSIPLHLYEAAAIDGAGPVARFRFITLPMLSPTLFFLMVMGAIGALQTFDTPLILTQGGPGDASRTIAMYIYEHGFQFLRMGYASALALTLFVLVLLLTLLQFRLAGRWVYYR